MFSYSNFKHEWDLKSETHEVPLSDQYKVFANGIEIPVYSTRISKYPFNTMWPGHQRPLSQTELVSYVNLVSDEEITIEVLALSNASIDRVILKPYSKGVKVSRDGNKFILTLRENGGYAFEINDYHQLLYIFNNKPVTAPAPNEVTYYFAPGVHFSGKIELKSNESIYIDKDALVYGCIYAENAQNIRVFGNGIFDDSAEERVTPHCYTAYTIGNLKLVNCTDISIEGVGFTNSAIWCINLFHCFDVNIDRINVFGQWRYNTDGIDVVNCSRVKIRNSFVHSFDDTIVIKGIDRYAYESIYDISVDECTLWCDWGMTCEVGLETNCPEYSNISFKNCDILRAGVCALDIANGDCAHVQNVTFEDIRIELESFYTPCVYQKSEDMLYEKHNEIEIPLIFKVSNNRFRDAYKHIGPPYAKKSGDATFASSSNVVAKDITIYCDEKILNSKALSDVARITFRNVVDGTEYGDITLCNLKLNGFPLKKDDLTITTIGKIDKLHILN